MYTYHSEFLITADMLIVFLLQIDLTWTRAVQMFEFLKPKALPEYDSLRTNTISAEV